MTRLRPAARARYRGAMRVLILVALVVAVAAPAASAGEPAKAVVIEGRLTRAEVQAVLERGPQRFIAGLRVAPHMVGGRFVGFRIEAIAPESPLVNGRAVVPGDVVVSVNGESVERPEQFMRAWEVVKGADRLEVLLLRGDRRLLYRWKIVP